MRSAPLLFLSSILGLACPVSTTSQVANSDDVQFVSSFVSGGEPAPPDCRQEAHIFTLSLAHYVRPASWHWVLICDEAGWRRFLRLSSRDEEANIYASTDLTAKYTFIRGSKLLAPYDLLVRPDDVVAHELAHIWLQSEDESSVENMDRESRKGQKKN